MTHYDRFKKRLDVVSLRINDNRPFDVSSLDPEVIKDPTKNIEYIVIGSVSNVMKLKELGNK